MEETMSCKDESAEGKELRDAYEQIMAESREKYPGVMEVIALYEGVQYGLKASRDYLSLGQESPVFSNSNSSM